MTKQIDTENPQYINQMTDRSLGNVPNMKQRAPQQNASNLLQKRTQMQPTISYDELSFAQQLKHARNLQLQGGPKNFKWRGKDYLAQYQEDVKKEVPKDIAKTIMLPPIEIIAKPVTPSSATQSVTQAPQPYAKKNNVSTKNQGVQTQSVKPTLDNKSIIKYAESNTNTSNFSPLDQRRIQLYRDWLIKQRMVHNVFLGPSGKWFM